MAQLKIEEDNARTRRESCRQRLLALPAYSTTEDRDLLEQHISSLESAESVARSSRAQTQASCDQLIHTAAELRAASRQAQRSQRQRTTSGTRWEVWHGVQPDLEYVAASFVWLLTCFPPRLSVYLYFWLESERASIYRFRMFAFLLFPSLFCLSPFPPPFPSLPFFSNLLRLLITEVPMSFPGVLLLIFLFSCSPTFRSIYTWSSSQFTLFWF